MTIPELLLSAGQLELSVCLLPQRILLGPYLEEAPPPRYRQSFAANLMLKADVDMGIVPSEMSTKRYVFWKFVFKLLCT